MAELILVGQLMVMMFMGALGRQQATKSNNETVKNIATYEQAVKDSK